MIKYLVAEKPNLTEKLVLISGLSIGSAPSFAIDFLIIANGFKRIGYLVSEHIQPSVGYLNKNIEGGALGLGCQIYQRGDNIIIQLRSGIRFGRRKEFIAEIANLLTDNESSPQILVLSSLPFSLRPDVQIQSLSNNIYYYSKQKESAVSRALQSSKGFKKLQQLLGQDEESKEIINQSGLLKQISKQNKLSKVSSIFVFSPEITDKNVALLLAKGARSVLGIQMNIKEFSHQISMDLLQ